MLEAQINWPYLHVPDFEAMPGASGDVNTDQVYRTQLRCECYSGKTKRSKYKDDITELIATTGPVKALAHSSPRPACMVTKELGFQNFC